ncbi:hypothetical protein L4C36_10495 [Photobacterium japonica]|uniref:hypothetical protein n=1 Tax=Photobacterium japonica TaxID=2910235 RepID=UPI003D1090F2
MIELRRDERHFDLNITDLKNNRVIFSESCKKSALKSNRYQREFVTGNMLTCKNEDARFTLFDYMNEEKEIVQSTGIDVQVEETKFTYYCKKNTINFIHELVQ